MLAKIIGIVGSLAGIASFLLGWGKLVMVRGGGSATREIGGIELLQGQIGLGLAVVSLILLFVRPKLAIFSGFLMMGAGIWYYVEKILDSPIKPSYGVWAIILGGVLVVVAGLMAPKKA